MKAKALVYTQLSFHEILSVNILQFGGKCTRIFFVQSWRGGKKKHLWTPLSRVFFPQNRGRIRYLRASRVQSLRITENFHVRASGTTKKARRSARAPMRKWAATLSTFYFYISRGDARSAATGEIKLLRVKQRRSFQYISK